MMKENVIRVLSLWMAMLFEMCIFAQEAHKVYYDEDWKGVQIKDFAYHELIYVPSTDARYRSRFVLKFASGEKEGEGEFVKIDELDFTKSILGSYKLFYKNGKPLVEYKLDGNKMDYTSYYPSGLIENKQTYVDGQLDGISYHFTEDGEGCFQTLYENGETVGPYYTFSNKDGLVTKYKFKDGKVFQQTPSSDEMKRNGAYMYYVKNGIVVYARTYYGYDYKFETFGGKGKYIMANIVIKNNTNAPINFNAGAISASIIKKNKRMAARLINMREYTKTVGSVQNAMISAKIYTEQKAANAAAYSFSSANTNTYYSGSSVTGTVGATVAGAVGTNGAAIGAAVGASLSKSAYSGNINTTTNVVSYSGAAAYQANLIAEQRVKDYAYKLGSDATIAISGYLPSKTIQPGETISGKILFDYEKADVIELRIPINGIIYTF
ncbi:MAG: hypothetical protein U0L52_05230 [Bacteroidaceae bacterium]|nr:hypothetical protein [Bacteroidaceae bacterium]